VDAIGFALGIERIILARGENAVAPVQKLGVYVICLDEAGFPSAFKLLSSLRDKGISGDINFKAASMKSQMRSADKSGAKFAAILGEDEIKNGTVTLKNLGDGTQNSFSMNNINDIIKAVS
jgi:histidyl-tRNA synthetase